jgi:ABC-type Zn2+ transport system substrate-binding protein/surface adhesin
MQKKIAHQKSKGYLKMDDNIQAYEKQYKVKMFTHYTITRQTTQPV